ncbi:MAG: lipoate--protein ligase family protein [Paludibacteraceae bacterium]|nr:lipoate--protein ligase family protein [Paludibacteraceae bacterium]
MKILRFPEKLPLTDYLDLEQQLVRDVQEPLFFTWIVAPTVIYGRHQQAEAELNQAYCREHGIAVVQRKSGGGCVYADSGNLMLSLISPSPHSEVVFADFLRMLCQALQDGGLPAVTTTHNDVLVSERKVSGCASYTTPTGTIVHSTLLFDVNLDAMVQALTPSQTKLSKHGVASVRQRVANLTELTDVFPDIFALRAHIEHAFSRF